VRLASNAGGPFEWLVGGYYTDEKGLIYQEYVAVQPGTLTELTTLPLLAELTLNSRYKEYAGFANATVHLGDRFDVDLGGRYSHNKQTADQTAAGVLAGGGADQQRPDLVGQRLHLFAGAQVQAR
jgi:iron complex outermembrane receptor protein